MFANNKGDKIHTILGIETSCDETSVGIVRDGKVLSNIIASQQVHSEYGGVVPEMASREHERLLAHITQTALDSDELTMDEIDAIAVTSGPGLMGALLVGVSFAKGIAIRNRIPVYNINHIEAHLLANLIEHQDLTYPFLCLLVSGGHTQIIKVTDYKSYKILGTTIDDAAGEAFDKVARLLNLGYPGGPIIDKMAQNGNPNRYDFPRGLRDSDDLNFSFSGLKTAVLYTVHSMTEEQREDAAPDISASFQEAVVDSLMIKLSQAVRHTSITKITIAGGVAANTRLRARLKQLKRDLEVKIYYPDFQYCTDNGAMIAYAGWHEAQNGQSDSLRFSAEPQLSISEN